MIQTAEGAMNELSNIMIRLRELSIQGASDTIGNTERGFIDKEVQQLKGEVDRIANATEFNGKKLLAGNTDTIEVQVGLNFDPAVNRFNFYTKELNSTVDAFGISDVSTASKESSQNNLATLDSAISRLNRNRSTLGGLQNRFQSAINNLGIYRENLEQANSRIRDTDMAEETANLTKGNILTQANISVLSQANANPELALKLLG